MKEINKVPEETGLEAPSSVQDIDKMTINDLEESPASTGVDDLSIEDFEAEEEKEKNKEDDGNSGVEMLAGATVGVIDGVTSTVSLAVDVADLVDNKLLGDLVKDSSIRKIHGALNIADTAADRMGVDTESGWYKNSRAIGEGVVIGLQLMSGVGAVAQGAKLGRTMGKFAVPSLKSAKEGAKAIAKGNKKQALGKAALVGGAEEVISKSAGDQQGLITSTFLDNGDLEIARDNSDEVHALLNRADPELGRIGAEYLAVNPKREADSEKRLINRLTSVVDGAVFGVAAESVIRAGVAFYKASKKTRVNINKAKDFKEDANSAAKKIKEAEEAGEEITDELRAKKLKESQEARKAKKRKEDEAFTPEEKRAQVNSAVYKDIETVQVLEDQIKEVTEFVNDESLPLAFEKAAKGQKLTEDELVSFKKFSRMQNRIGKMNKGKMKFAAQQDKRTAEDILKDPNAVLKMKKNFEATVQKIDDHKNKVIKFRAAVTKRMKKDLGEFGDYSANDIVVMEELNRALAFSEGKLEAIGSFQGQALRYFKDLKPTRDATVQRFTDFVKKNHGYKEDTADFLDFKIEVDEAIVSGKITEVMKKFGFVEGQESAFMKFYNRTKDGASSLYRSNLLLSVRGPFRNFTEGVLLSKTVQARDAAVEGVLAIANKAGATSEKGSIKGVIDATKKGDIASIGEAKQTASNMWEQAKVHVQSLTDKRFIADQIEDLKKVDADSNKSYLSKIHPRDETAVNLIQEALKKNDQNFLKRYSLEYLSNFDSLGGWEKYTSVATMGRKAVIGADKILTAGNIVYKVQKRFQETVDKIDTTHFTGVLDKISESGRLNPQDRQMVDFLNSFGLSSVELVKQRKASGLSSEDFAASFFKPESMNSLTKGKANNFYDKFSNNQGVLKEAEVYADKLAMNSDPDDLHFTAKWFGKGAVAISNLPVLNTFMPFAKPAASSLDWAIGAAPIMNWGRNAQKLWRGNDREKAEALVNLSLTHASLAGLWGLKESGIVQGGGPKDPKLRKAWGEQGAGNRPYTIKVGDEYVSMQGTLFGTVSTVLSDMIDIQAQMHDGSVQSEDKMNHLTTGIGLIMLDLPQSFWTQSFNPVLNAIKSSGSIGGVQGQLAMSTLLQNMIKSTPAGTALQISKEVKSITDPNKYDTQIDKDESGFDATIMRTWNELKKQTIGVEIAKRRSYITGEPLGSGRENGKGAFFSMSSFKEAKHKDVKDYLSGLMMGAGFRTGISDKNNLRITEPQRHIQVTVDGKGYNYNLNADEYERLTVLTANPKGMPPLVEAIRDLSKDFPWKGTGEQKDKDIAIEETRKLIVDYKKAAREQFKDESDEFRAYEVEADVEETNRQELNIR
jgi:hypothetical protein